MSAARKPSTLSFRIAPPPPRRGGHDWLPLSVATWLLAAMAVATLARII